MRKKLWKHLGLFVTVAMLLLSGTLSVSAADSRIEETSVNMGDRTAVESCFKGYYVERFGYPVRSEDIDIHWTFQDDYAQRTNDIFLNNETEYIAGLCYQKKKMQDFDMSVSYRLGGSNYTWAAVAIRQQVPGKYYLEEGGGGAVFVQENGKVTLWGPVFNGGPHEYNNKLDVTYDPYAWHELRIVAQGSQLTVYLDGILQFTHTMASSGIVSGFITLMSINTDCSFRNFRFTDLTVETVVGYEAPVNPPAGGMNIDEIAQVIE